MICSLDLSVIMLPALLSTGLRFLGHSGLNDGYQINLVIEYSIYICFARLNVLFLQFICVACASPGRMPVSLERNYATTKKTKEAAWATPAASPGHLWTI